MAPGISTHGLDPSFVSWCLRGASPEDPLMLSASVLRPAGTADTFGISGTHVPARHKRRKTLLRQGRGQPLPREPPRSEYAGCNELALEIRGRRFDIGPDVTYPYSRPGNRTRFPACSPLCPPKCIAAKPSVASGDVTTYYG
jgi:hypothetical protein